MDNPFDKFDSNQAENPFDRFDENSKKKKTETSTMQSIMQDAGNAVSGLVRGAGSLGSTILLPADMINQKLRGEDFWSMKDNVQRRKDIDSALQGMGADPNSTLYKTGKLGAEIAGTAGAGGAIANVLGKAAPVLANSPILQSIATSGMSSGKLGGAAGMASKVLGGATSGGVSSAMIDPETAGAGAVLGGLLPPTIKVLGKAGNLARQATSGAAKHTLGLMTGAGSETFGTAYKAGKEGGTSFLENMRGKVDPSEVIESAKDALSQMRIDRGNQYRSGMIDIANDKAIIDFTPIDKVAESLKKMGTFKGQVINKNAAGTVDEISDVVNQWKSLDPAEYHTPEGLDALKKSIGDIRDATQFGTASRKAADTAYNAVKTQIESQAPTYAKVMKDYSQASKALSEIENSLSIGNKASTDTALRKFQSLMRNNVNTNYGNRLSLAKALEDQGADILPAVAGQAASSFTPRGLQGLAASGIGATGLMTTNPIALATLPFTSPRLMGEAAYGLGAINRGIGNAVSKIPIPSKSIESTKGGLSKLKLQEQLNQLGYQSMPAAYANFNR